VSRRISSDWVCIQCKDPSQKHYGKDLCKRCYMIAFRRRHGIQPAHRREPKACVQCGQVLLIEGRGLCAGCYRKFFRQTHPAYIAGLERELSDRKRFGGRREEIVARARGRCELCGMTEDASVKRWRCRLEVHHKDGNNRLSEHPNHALSNLQLLCKQCHRAVHGNNKKRIAS
jgi:hypothetical protein